MTRAIDGLQLGIGRAAVCSGGVDGAKTTQERQFDGGLRKVIVDIFQQLARARRVVDVGVELYDIGGFGLCIVQRRRVEGGWIRRRAALAAGQPGRPIPAPHGCASLAVRPALVTNLRPVQP